MDKKETVILYRGQIESLLSLSSLRDVKTILRAIVSYSMDGVEPEIPEHLAFGWQWFKHSIEQNNNAYTEMVSKRRDAANKRWENNANAGKTMQTMQVHANDASACKRCYNDNDNDLKKRESIIRAHASDAERIAGIYPRAKVGNYRALVESVINAIIRELDRPGTEPDEAVFRVESGTIAYAQAVKKWKHKKYISDAVKFFDSGMYNHDPATWEQPENISGKTENKRKNDPYDPSTWENN